MKITDDADKPLPWDGKTFGRPQGARPAVARAYFKATATILDQEGFFDTGDVATIDRYGYMQITDRSKDVIKSGGEWISSIDLENLAVGHPKVAEAAVIGVKHPKWDERPLLVIVLKKGQAASRDEILRLHAGQGRQMVDARRRRFRRRDPAHGDRQDPETVQQRYNNATMPEAAPTPQPRAKRPNPPRPRGPGPPGPQGGIPPLAAGGGRGKHNTTTASSKTNPGARAAPGGTPKHGPSGPRGTACDTAPTATHGDAPPPGHGMREVDVGD